MPVCPELLLMLNSSILGDGEPDLGEELLKSYLSILWESGRIPAKIICLNSGIFLATEGSPVMELMQKFASAGSEILTCKTCLAYYGRSDKLVVGRPGDMKDTVTAQVTFEKVISPC